MNAKVNFTKDELTRIDLTLYAALAYFSDNEQYGDDWTDEIYDLTVLSSVVDEVLEKNVKELLVLIEDE